MDEAIKHTAQKKDQDVFRPDPAHFSAEINALLRESEAMRLFYMKRHGRQKNIGTTLGLMSMLLGAGGFGWFLLVEADLMRALAAMTLAIIVPLYLSLKTENTLKLYTKAYKNNLLPRIAAALGGLEFHQNRGIKESLLKKTGILPAYDTYAAEDCFMGTYRGVKITFSEARLSLKQSRDIEPFSGVFVLLELDTPHFTGHTILTADQRLYDTWRTTRWQKLQTVPLSPEEAEDADCFHAVSSAPDTAANLLGKHLLKELADIMDSFNGAPLTAAFFQERFIFFMIPYARNMFEPSNIYLPMNTTRHALECKREIEQILQIIDVLQLYRN